jgi:enamine deaminase RidA (YjgF/YER057c/UK114 family)
MVERRTVNPWTWQDEMGFSQAIEVTGARRELVCSGQTSVDTDGHPLHPGDMRAQAAQALDNLEAVLNAAGFQLSDIVRLNFYVTDVDAFFGAADVIGARLGAAGVKPPGTLLGVSRLAFPELMIEMEATAMA